MELQLYEIQNKIYEIRSRKVMLDFDLAEVYGVETRRLKEQVRRNIERFPNDFMFQLSKSEWRELVANCDKLPTSIRHSPVTPLAFTQEGAATLSGVLRSPIAIQANVNIMRAFVAVREYLLTHASQSVEIAQLRERVLILERTTDNNTGAINENIEAINDLSEDIGKEFETIYDAIGALSVKMPKIDKPRPRIGFKRGNE